MDQSVRGAVSRGWMGYGWGEKGRWGVKYSFKMKQSVDNVL